LAAAVEEPVGALRCAARGEEMFARLDVPVVVDPSALRAVTLVNEARAIIDREAGIESEPIEIDVLDAVGEQAEVGVLHRRVPGPHITTRSAVDQRFDDHLAAELRIHLRRARDEPTAVRRELAACRVHELRLIEFFLALLVVENLRPALILEIPDLERLDAR